MNTTASKTIPEVFADVEAVDSVVAVDVRAVVGKTVDVDVAVKTVTIYHIVKGNTVSVSVRKQIGHVQSNLTTNADGYIL